MKRISVLSVISLACACVVNAQGRPIDIPSAGVDAQRSGWEKVDVRITHDNAKDFELIWKRKLENQQQGPRALTPPVVLGNLISYRGFKELAFLAGSSDNLWAIDVDLNRVFWHKHFETAGSAARSGCPGGFAATPALTPPMNFAARPRPVLGATGTPAAPRPNPNAPMTPMPKPTGRAILTAGGFGSPRPAFAISSDGKLHLLNTSTGDDVIPAMDFLPSGSTPSSVTVLDNVVYTTTSSACGGSNTGIWAIDLGGDPKAPPVVASYPISGGDIAGLTGAAFGTDGTVYAQTKPGELVALTPKELKLRHSAKLPNGGADASPLVFAYRGHDLIVTAGGDQSLYLLDSKDLGVLSQSEPLPSKGIWGGLSSWQDSTGTRWVYAPVWGSTGSIVAFKVEDQSGKPVLTKVWSSHEMKSPEPPVITAGVVFALAAGDASTNARLYALDAATGHEIYNSGNQVTAQGSLTGLTLANGRVFFTTVDNTLYAFGIHMEI